MVWENWKAPHTLIPVYDLTAKQHSCSVCHYHNFDSEFFLNSLNHFLNDIEYDEALGTSIQQHIVLDKHFLTVKLIFSCLHIYTEKTVYAWLHMCVWCALRWKIFTLCVWQTSTCIVCIFTSRMNKRGWEGNMGEMNEGDEVYEN